MRLPRPFFQLPVLFDVARLQAEVAALPEEAWVSHPDRLAGNSAARLISAGGAETDSVHGQMLPTSWLATMPYVRQALAGFGVVWSRSRLMRLAPRANVPEHADINHHWHTRVRLHIPIFTRPEVRFHCDGQAVHMGQGEAWIFDNWRRHHVENGAEVERIHLVADTTGTAAFWQVAQGRKPPRAAWPTLSWNPGSETPLLTERNERAAIMPAAEVQWLIDDFFSGLRMVGDSPEAKARAERFRMLLENFVFDWRQLCALHGSDSRGAPYFLHLAAAVREAAKPLAQGLVMRSNNVGAFLVLEKRVLEHLIASDAT